MLHEENKRALQYSMFLKEKCNGRSKQEGVQIVGRKWSIQQNQTWPQGKAQPN